MSEVSRAVVTDRGEAGFYGLLQAAKAQIVRRFLRINHVSFDQLRLDSCCPDRRSWLLSLLICEATDQIARIRPLSLLELTFDILEARNTGYREQFVIDLTVFCVNQLLGKLIMVTDCVEYLIGVQLAQVLELFDNDIGESYQSVLCRGLKHPHFIIYFVC